MEEVIENIIKEINSKENLTKDQKIRLAYIRLGESVHLNANFFYSLYNLLDKDLKYSLEDIHKIYGNLKPSYYVICRDCALMLKTIFDGCGIKSEVKQTCEIDHYEYNEGTIDVQHFFICAEGDNNQKYFLSLVLDLPYIQLGMETEHFATNIVYTNDLGEQVYEGEEIDNTVLSKDYIKQLDESIGYLTFKWDSKEAKNTYFNESLNILRDAYQRNKEYYFKLATSKNNQFYTGLINILSEEEDSLSVRLSSIDSEKEECIKKYICTMIKNKVNTELNLSDDINNKLNELLEKKEYNKYIQFIHNSIKENNYKGNNEFNLYALTTSAPKLFNVIEKIKNATDYNSEEFNKLKTLLNVYILKLATAFTDKKYHPGKNGQYTNEYIANKIKVLFPDIFDFNHNTAFTHMEVGEKTVIIKRIMNSIFPELSNDKYVKRKVENPVENRIKTCMIYDKLEKEYKLLINIEVANTENNEILIYNFNDGKNKFEELDDDISLLEMVSDKERYNFLSKNLAIRAQENIELPKKGRRHK